MKRSIMLIFSLFFIIPSVCLSASLSSQTHPKSLQNINISEDSTLLIDKFNNEIHSINLDSLKDNWSKKFARIYDVKVLENPTKIIVLAKINNKLAKLSVDKDGKIINQQLFSSPNISTLLQDNSAIASWSAPSSTTREKIAIYKADEIKIFEYPWKTQSMSIEMKPRDNIFEGVYRDSMNFNWPYIVTKNIGSSLMFSVEFYHVYNLSTKKSFEVDVDEYTNSQYTIENGILVINTSSNNPTPTGINPTADYNIYSRYNLATGKLTYQLKRQFNDPEAAWRTNYYNQQLYLFDSTTKEYYLFNKIGAKLKTVNHTLQTNDLSFIGLRNDDFIMLARSSSGVQLNRIPSK